MPRLISELIVSLDMKARGLKSPGYYGYMGPEFQSWLNTNNAEPHRTLIGRKTYELVNALPDAAKDEGWHRATRQPGYLFSRTLKTSDWPGLELISGDLLRVAPKLKQDGGPELRVLGSLSLMRQLVAVELLDVLRLIVCPLVVPDSGIEATFEGMDDLALDLAATRVLDGRVLLLDYRPAGQPPFNN